MTKKEKIISTLLAFSMLLLITSSIYTFYQLKPAGHEFLIEKISKYF